jgi:hypothetical protein
MWGTTANLASNMFLPESLRSIACCVLRVHAHPEERAEHTPRSTTVTPVETFLVILLFFGFGCLLLLAIPASPPYSFLVLPPLSFLSFFLLFYISPRIACRKIFPFSPLFF